VYVIKIKVYICEKYLIMFHKEFYPTPINVLQMMDIDAENKIVLEPSAGKGDIIDFCRIQGAKDVFAYEINADLQKIITSKCQILGDNFLNSKAEDISHVQLIVMNPPFSNADKHICHAWKIAPEGCEIIALCNHETVNKDYLYREINSIITNYGTVVNLGDCFSTAERSTGVEIACVKLYKPVISSEFDFSGFFMDEEQSESDDTPGVMQYNEVQALVNRHVGAMKIFDKLKDQVDALNYTLDAIGMRGIDINVGHNDNITTKEQFSKLIQRKSWAYIFSKMKLEKYVTSGVMKDINKFVETQNNVPFTMKNIYRMFDIIVGTREETFKRALEEAVDNFTKHTHENRFGIEGWKTNSGYMLNKKFIVENVIGGYMGFEIKYDSRNSKHIDDLTKVMCNITGVNYDDIGTLYRFNYGKDYNKKFELTPNTWYEWGFFEIKFFKKGTMHIKFIDTQQWYLLNQAYGKLKGFTLSDKYKN